MSDLRTLLAVLWMGAAGCAAFARRPPPPKPAAPRPLSAAQRRDIDRVYYRAVQAYLEERYEEARRLVKNILKRDPRHAPSIELRQRIEAAGPR